MVKMKKLVIVDRGASNIGKSAAIKSVYYLLMSKGYEIVHKQWQHNEDEDIRVIFNIEGFRVGIESLGDPDVREIMEKTIDDFVDAGCAIIVTACRPDGNTYNKVINDLEEKGYEILWYAHYVYQVLGMDAVRERLNYEYAQHVVKLIEDRIAGKI